MGRDKAMLPLGQHTVLHALIATVQPMFSATVLSVRTPRPDIDLPQICDADETGGPLSGMVSALAKTPTTWAFVAACDMPFIAPPLIEQLASHRAHQQAIIPVVNGHSQPLAALYATACLPQLRACLASNDHSLMGALRRLQATYLDESVMIQADPSLHSFFDLDTPADWTRAQQIHKARAQS